MLFRATPIRLLIPALVLIMGLGSNAISYIISRDTAFDLLIEQRQARLRADLARHQLELEGATPDELPFFQRDISALLHYPDVTHAQLLDSDHQVIASTRLGEIGQPVDLALLGLDREQFASSMARPAPHLWQSPDGNDLSGVIRICRVDAAAVNARRDCGMMFVREDLDAPLATVNSSLLQQLFYSASLTLLLVAVVIGALHLAVVQRLDAIVQTAMAYSRGDGDARAAAAGGDEISAIGRAINHMLDRVSATQRRLRNRQAYLTALFNENTEGLIVINRDGVVTEFNQRSEAIFGYRAEEVVGHNVSMLMTQSDAVHHQAMIDRFVENRKSRVVARQRALQTVGRHRDGQEVPISIAISEVRAADDLTFIGSVTDLTNIRSLEQQAERAQKMEAVGALTGGIAHDFNNLLGIIIGNLDLLLRQLDGDARLGKRAQRALDAASRGAALTNKLLGFARQRPERAEPVVVRDVLDAMETLLDHSLTSRICLAHEFAEDLPAVLVDPSSLGDVIVNLVLNARDAMPDGGDLRITARSVSLTGQIPGRCVHGVTEGEFVELAVIDHGHGIPGDVLTRVFDPFFSTKPKDKGTGLGLAMVYGFVQRASAAIGIDSSEGVGTTVRLYLPVAEDRPDPAAVLNDRKLSLSARTGERVLVVDDEPQLRELATAELFRLGYDTAEAANAAEALSILENDARFDLLFSDVLMPGELDGIGLADKVNRRYPELAVLLTSGFAGQVQPDNDEARVWMQRILEKPYTLESMAMAVRDAIDRPSA